MKAILALEDGTVFHGESFAASGEVTGEAIFNTSMTGYQEMLTDPSYAGQIVMPTWAPLVRPSLPTRHRPFGQEKISRTRSVARGVVQTW